MTAAPSIYAKARADVAGMLRYDLDNLSAEQATRLDIATALRVLLDNQTGKLLRGESLDARELLMASDALAKILPSLAEPPPTSREDPRQTMWLIYKQMRERGELNLKPPPPEDHFQQRIAALEAEIIALGGHPSAPEPGVSQHRGEVENRISGHLCGSINPSEGDITPSSELGQCHVGVVRGPDDPPPRSTTVIEAKAVPNPPAARPPQNWDDTAGGKAWQAWVDAGGSVGGDRWSNRNE
jgi:hypothetical protein